MRVAYVGNFSTPASTESHVAQAIRYLGHDLRTLQENELQTWRWLVDGHVLEGLDMLLWTRTAWDWHALGITPAEAHNMQYAMLANAEARGVPTVGFHLDKWFGLKREHELRTEPFFRCSIVVTADGGHERQWKELGVNHVWMPPGVSEFECVPGSFTPAMASDVAFVGSWQDYHQEHRHRFEMVDWLQRTYGGRVGFWPKPGQPAVRGEPLRDLYASTKVNVGDSCLIPNADGSPTRRYWSDRVPECVGRGGLLIHPYVEGLEQHFDIENHLAVWDLWNWDQLRSQIERYLGDDDARARVAVAGQAHVLANHTYTVRMKQVAALL